MNSDLCFFSSFALQSSHEGEFFTAETHNDVVFCRPSCHSFSWFPGGERRKFSANPFPVQHHRHTTPSWSCARLWLNKGAADQSITFVWCKALRPLCLRVSFMPPTSQNIQIYLCQHCDSKRLCKLLLSDSNNNITDSRLFFICQTSSGRKYKFKTYDE